MRRDFGALSALARSCVCCVRWGQEDGEAREAAGAAGREARTKLQAQATLLEVELAHLKAGCRPCPKTRARVSGRALSWRV